MYCQNCGEEIAEDSVFCSCCGVKIVLQKRKKRLGKKIIVLVISLVLMGLAVTAMLLFIKTAKAEKVEKMLNLGEKYLSELEYEQAIAAYEAVIEIDPKCEDAYLALADIYIAMGAFKKAEKVLAKAEEKLGSAMSEDIESKKDEVEEAEYVQEEPEDVKIDTSANESSDIGSVSEPTGAPTPTPEPSPTGTPTPTPTPEPSPTSTPIPTPTSEPSPTGTPTPTPTPEPSPTSTPIPTPTPTPKIELTKRYETKADEVRKNGVKLYYYSISYPVFEGQGAENYNLLILPKVDAFLENAVSNMQWIAESDPEELGIYDTWYDYGSVSSTESGLLMSISVFEETYMGTNRPHYSSGNYVYNVATGENAVIDEILSAYDVTKEQIAEYVLTELYGAYGSNKEEYNGDPESFVMSSIDEDWSLNSDGISVNISFTYLPVPNYDLDFICDISFDKMRELGQN